MYQLMADQLTAQPDLALGGPTVRWLREGLRECAELARLPSPVQPCITFLGTEEQIVSPDAIRRRMQNWPGGELELIEKGRHEVLMETPDIRIHVLDRICGLFDRHCG
jgi:lysophospholipase